MLPETGLCRQKFSTAAPRRIISAGVSDVISGLYGKWKILNPDGIERATLSSANSKGKAALHTHYGEAVRFH
jgi:hypothetical protein